MGLLMDGQNLAACHRMRLQDVGCYLLVAMGGTALSILAPHDTERIESIVIEEMIAEGLHRYEPDPRYWYSADGVPYGYVIGAPGADVDAEELRLVEQAAGMAMGCVVELHIFVSDRAGRLALAQIAQRVAGRIEGWVFVELDGLPCPDLLDHLDGGGRCVRVDGAGYLDAEATARWINHPDFHVVK
ncbi:hypothetical protein GCM10009541_53620 [Micromonospora gifhornensis]|uniref:Uncharacterized protein n=1 Tax=Micromonospora gifhornensis TaxID=84594 RepID=A0ABQ4IKJ1_9ACTN|nr:hypothetical protein [Micromonospora gifhornensis]GIJ18429.1 hypothetical protein Vgi01_51130 [Micromonospora gifhornensis]